MCCVDLTFFDVNTTSWRTQIHPSISGDKPFSRMHFGAACVGNYLLLLGGCEPTSLVTRHVEPDTTSISILNLSTFVWKRPFPINSKEHLLQNQQIAESDVIRAKQRVSEEKARGLSYGVANGKTVEYAEAEAVLSVCNWRLSMLKKEEADMRHSPLGRFGATLTKLGQRFMFIGGWSSRSDSSYATNIPMVLDVEQEHERRRRLDDEFHARLQRNR